MSALRAARPAQWDDDARKAADGRQKPTRDKSDAPPPAPLPIDQLESLLIASTPWILVAVGGIGFAAIVLLMVLKPF